MAEAELTVPMSVLERWLQNAYSTGYVRGPGTTPVVLWELGDDGTLSPVLQNNRRCQFTNTNGGRCVLTYGHTQAHLYPTDGE